jgi:hypothetical protein
MDDMKESSDLDVRGGLLQSMMMLFTFMGVPRFKKTSQLQVTLHGTISSCAEVFGGYSSVPWLRDAMDFLWFL